MRPYRRNADERLRQLDRAARAGDPAAHQALQQEHLRLGTFTPEWLANADVRELQFLLPGELLSSMYHNLMLARHTLQWNLPGRSSRGGWFPDHSPQNVCPRRHPVEDSGFDYTVVGVSWDRVREATADTIMPDYDRETGESEAEWVTCRQCGANWPVGEIGDY